MVEARFEELEDQVTNLRIDQSKLESKLDSAMFAIAKLTDSVDHLTGAMNRAAGERTGAKAAFATIGAIVGAIGAMVVEWFASHR